MQQELQHFLPRNHKPREVSTPYYARCKIDPVWSCRSRGQDAKGRLALAGNLDDARRFCIWNLAAEWRD